MLIAVSTEENWGARVPMVVRKYLEEADENFRRAFGFIGSGELTIDQVMKGLE